MNIKKSILIRVRVGYLFVLIFAVAIVVKIGYIQTVEGKKWAEIGEHTSFGYRPVKATRGNIYADNESLLATSLPNYKVAFDATQASDKIFNAGLDSLSYRLSHFYNDRSATEYRRLLIDARRSDRRYMILNSESIGYQAKKMMSQWPIFRDGRLHGGVIFEKSEDRFHPFVNLSRRTVGYVNDNGAGAGLEYSYNDVLGGKDGEVMYQKIAGGTLKPVFDADNTKSVDGLDILTTIDVNTQDVAESALLHGMQKHNADDGLVVVMEVKTGEVKAIANLSNDGNGHFYEKYNFATGMVFEPGSTFKLVTMIALLEGTSVQLSDSIDTGNGEYVFYNHKVRDHEEGGLGKITVQQVFEHSSNVGTAKLADKYFKSNPEKYIAYIDKLKLSQPLGIQIKGEAMPKFTRPGEKGWSGISLPWMSHGYGIEISPLQTLTLYNAVANDGKMIKPIFVKEIRKADVVEKSFETEVINKKICSSATLEKLKMLLEGVVKNGTAKGIYNDEYKIAGKTGTAQLLENGHYTKKYLTSFVGYFPADAPKYSMIVVIRNPKGFQQYGSNVSAPVFKEISDNIYSRDLNMHPPLIVEKYKEKGVFPVIQAGLQQDLAFLCNELGVSNHSDTDEEWVRAKRNGDAVEWVKNYSGKGIVPDVKGMTFRDAVYLLETAGLDVHYTGSGRVEEQSLIPGTHIAQGNRIFIRLDGWLN